eukprot:scaffold158_cov126-Isochrysis_galbana.AAC.5
MWIRFPQSLVSQRRAKAPTNVRQKAAISLPATPAPAFPPYSKLAAPRRGPLLYIMPGFSAGRVHCRCETGFNVRAMASSELHACSMPSLRRTGAHTYMGNAGCWQELCCLWRCVLACGYIYMYCRASRAARPRVVVARSFRAVGPLSPIYSARLINFQLPREHMHVQHAHARAHVHA